MTCKSLSSLSSQPRIDWLETVSGIQAGLDRQVCIFAINAPVLQYARRELTRRGDRAVHVRRQHAL
jgi:hypothetical protein